MKGSFNEFSASNYKFVCRYCLICEKIDGLSQSITEVKSHFNSAEIKSWSDAVKNIPVQLKSNTDHVNQLITNNKLINDEITSFKSIISQNNQTNQPESLSAPQLRQATAE